METLREFLRRIGMLRHRNQTANELQEEMQLHLDLRRQQQVESGVAPNDAAAATHRRFGNPTLLREQSYTAWGWQWLETLLQDMLYGLRAMRRSPSFTAVALLSLALGIGANTAIFTLINQALLHKLPVPDPQQLVAFGNSESEGIAGGIDLGEFGGYFPWDFARQLQADPGHFKE